MFRAIIEKIDTNKTPYEVLYKAYNGMNAGLLPNGIDLRNEPILGQAVLFSAVGEKSTPQKGDIAWIEKTKEGHYIAFCTDWIDSPNTTTNEKAVGNFKANNFIRMNDSQILIQEDGTEEVYVSTKNIDLNCSEEFIVNADNKASINSSSSLELFSNNVKIGDATAVNAVAYVGCLVDLNPVSPTYGQIIQGSSKAKVSI